MKSSPYEHLSHKFKLALSTAIMAAMVVPAAYAQDNSDESEDDEVVVTGIRQALSKARDIKRDADTAVDSITASDVSTLPDLSVAEALARIPGVTVQRIGLGNSDGDFPSPEGGGNLIRGLTLVKTEFNGRDAFSANQGRALDFGTVPPELIGSVDVYKNTSADRVEGGIGGGINLQTLEPFDRTGRVAVITLDGTYTDLREEVTPDASVVLGDRWVNNNGAEFGLLGSVSHSELKSELHGFQIGQLHAIDTGTEVVAVPGGFQLRTNEVDRERQSYYLAGQYRNPDGTFEATLKYARIDNDVDSDERTMEWFTQGEPGNYNNLSLVGAYTSTPFTSAGIPNCQGEGDIPDNPQCELTNPVNALYTGGVISNEFRDWTGGAGAPFTNLGIHQKDRSTTDDISLNMKWRPADNWYVTADVHKTTAEFQRDRLWGGTRFFSDYEMNLDLDNPMVRLVPDPASNPLRRFQDGSVAGAWNGGTPLNGDFSDPENTFLLFAADEFQDNDGEMWAARGDVEYETDGDGWFDGVQFGVRYAERDQVNRNAGLNWAAVAPVWEGFAGNTYLPVGESQAGFEAYDFSNFFRGGVVQGDNSTVLFANRDLLQNYDAWVAALRADPLITNSTNDECAVGDPQIRDWRPLRVNGVVDYACRGGIGDVTEKTQNAYVRVNFGEEFDNGMSIDGNFGVRYTKTIVSGEGGITYVPITSVEAQTFAPEATAYFNQAGTTISGAFNTDTQWLPSFNAKLNLNEDMLIRLGISKDITRPNIAQLRADQVAWAGLNFVVDNTDPMNSVITDVNPTRINLAGGNPNLKPIEAWNFDASFEYYFGDDNSFSLALFRKDITNNIVYGSTTVGTANLDGFDVPIVVNGDSNQDELEIQGFEVAYTHFFDSLPGILSNTGIQANYTYIDSTTNAPAAAQDSNGDGIPDNFLTVLRYGVEDSLGLSDHAVNVIGIYQDTKLEARLAYNWRSEYLSSYRDYVTGNPIYQTDRGYLDGSLKYDVNDNLQFRVQVANILDTKAKAEQQIDAEGQRIGRTAFLGDRRVKVGLRYQFD